MDELIRLLNEGNYSCVVRQGEETRTFSRRGVADLYDLYATSKSMVLSRETRNPGLVELRAEKRDPFKLCRH
jgi:dsDNA-binding SOS-regulon protein